MSLSLGLGLALTRNKGVLVAPAGFVFLVDENGAFWVDQNGAYILEAI